MPSQEAGAEHSLAFLHDLALDKMHPLSQAEREATELVHEAFRSADSIVVRLGGKAGRLGESVVGTALLEGILHALEIVGKAGTRVTIVVDEGVGELFDARDYQQAFWQDIEVLTAPFMQAQEVPKSMLELRGGERLLIVDAHGGNDGLPEVVVEEQDGRRVTKLVRLFRVGVRSYAVRGAHRRYADFVEDLLGLPARSIGDEQAQPRIRLSERDEGRYKDLVEQFGIDEDALRIVCSFQSVVVAKCYTGWDEGIMDFCRYLSNHFPATRVQFLLACGPDEQNPIGARRTDLEEVYGEIAGVNDNARIIVRETPSLRDLAIIMGHAAMVLANDTGPGHVAGAVEVPTITPYLPGTIYSMQVWASSLWHRGVTLEPNIFSYQQIEAAVLWDRTDVIDRIAPERLVEQMKKVLDQRPRKARFLERD